jgi:ATP-dependent RNA helicase DDX10/DBP4
LPIERFAAALGLPGAPKVKFVGREIAKGKKNAARAAALAKAEEERLGSSSDEEESDVEPDISDVKAEGSSKASDIALCQP